MWHVFVHESATYTFTVETTSGCCSSRLIKFLHMSVGMWFRRVSSDDTSSSGVPRGGGLGGSNPLPPEIPKALQNRAKLNFDCENF